MQVITRYEAAGPIIFGMSLEDVRSRLGDPSRISRNFLREQRLDYASLFVTIANDSAVEVEFLPEISVAVAGIDVFNDPVALTKLCELDGDPHICAGAIILPSFGVSMTGFHDRDESQKSVSAVARGRFDALQSLMKPFTL